MNDTPADVEERYHAMLMALAPEQRVRMACAMFGTAKALARAGLMAERSDDAEPSAAELFVRLYGDDYEPEERGRIIAWLDDRAARGGAPSGRPANAGECKDATV